MSSLVKLAVSRSSHDDLLVLLRAKRNTAERLAFVRELCEIYGALMEEYAADMTGPAQSARDAAVSVLGACLSADEAPKSSKPVVRAKGQRPATSPIPHDAIAVSGGLMTPAVIALEGVIEAATAYASLESIKNKDALFARLEAFFSWSAFAPLQILVLSLVKVRGNAHTSVMAEFVRAVCNFFGSIVHTEGLHPFSAGVQKLFELLVLLSGAFAAELPQLPMQAASLALSVLSELRDTRGDPAALLDCTSVLYMPSSVRTLWTAAYARTLAYDYLRFTVHLLEREVPSADLASRASLIAVLLRLRDIASFIVGDKQRSAALGSLRAFVLQVADVLEGVLQNNGTMERVSTLLAACDARQPARILVSFVSTNDEV